MEAGEEVPLSSSPRPSSLHQQKRSKGRERVPLFFPLFFFFGVYLIFLGYKGLGGG